MTAITMKHFDILDYVDQSKAFGMDERLAKYQARQIEQVIEIATNNARSEIENRELATKKDIRDVQKDIKELDLTLRAEIQKSKFELVVWVVGLFIVNGLLQHFFK